MDTWSSEQFKSLHTRPTRAILAAFHHRNKSLPRGGGEAEGQGYGVIIHIKVMTTVKTWT